VGIFDRYRACLGKFGCPRIGLGLKGRKWAYSVVLCCLNKKNKVNMLLVEQGNPLVFKITRVKIVKKTLIYLFVVDFC
jgi:hypothetical protein